MTDQTTDTTAAAASQATTETSTAQNSNAAAAATESGADKVTGTVSADTGTATTAAATTEAATSATTETVTAEAGELQKLRETLAGGDEKLLKHLERFKSTDAISKSFREARQAAQQAGKPIRLSDKATEDEVKAYREAMGIPPEPADYPVSFRDDFKATDVDKEILSSFKEALHQGNADPKAAAVALEWYQDFATQQQQQLDGNMAKVAKETQSALRSEWGGEYDGNINACEQIMKANLGAEGFNRMMGMRLSDGSRLQDDAAFVKMMAQIGSDYYGGNAIITGDVETTSQTIQEKIDGLLQLRVSDPEKYKSDATQSQITKLYAQRDKINARK